MRLTEGGLHEPNSSDWDDICAAVGPDTFCQMLFHDVGGVGLPAAEIGDESQDDIQRVLKGRARHSGYRSSHRTERVYRNHRPANLLPLGNLRPSGYDRDLAVRT